MVQSPVAVLFAQPRSIYKQLGVDVWDEKRDARKYAGPYPVVAHPPCRGWGRLSAFAKVVPGELDLARFATRAVREWGGVLEHPACSKLWRDGDLSLPVPGRSDGFGGWTYAINQSWFGHRAPKLTWLYICGTRTVPSVPFQLGEAGGRVALMGRPERERTPVLLAQWLIAVAASCTVDPRRASPCASAPAPRRTADLGGEVVHA
jgi:hypothetical protein